jgi:hypothetical protein
MAEPTRPELRASDVDRELTVSQLRRHTTAGRLTLDELDQRLEWTYAAKTLADLAKVTSDLPRLTDEAVAPPVVASTERDERRASRVARRGRSHVAGREETSHDRAAWGGMLTTSLTVILIWALTGFGYPWFLWVVGPAAIALVSREVRHRTQPPEGEDRRP